MPWPFAAKGDPVWGYCPQQSWVEGKSWPSLANASDQILTDILRSGGYREKKRERRFGVSDDWKKLHGILCTYSESESLKGSCHEGPIQNIHLV